MSINNQQKEFSMLSRRTLTLFSTLSLSFLFILGGCTEDSNPTQSQGEPDGVLDVVMDYSVSGDKLIMPFEESINVYSYCIGDSLVTESDTTKASVDTMKFSQSGNTLKVAVEEFSVNEDDSMLVTLWQVFARKGSGSGLEGTWSSTGLDYTVTGGEITEAQKTELEEMLKGENEEMDLVVTSGQIKVYYQENTENLADEFINDWNGEGYSDPADSDSATYDITVTKVDASTVQLKGNKTDETVTIVLSDEKEVYSSSNSENATGAYMYEPENCPNTVPSWYYAFLSGNSRTGMAKQAKTTVTPRRSPGCSKKSSNPFDLR